MKCRILKNTKGSPDGITVQEYKKGEICEIPEPLAKVFISIGAAILKVEEKSISMAPKNKAVFSSQNKEVETDTKKIKIKKDEK